MTERIFAGLSCALVLCLAACMTSRMPERIGADGGSSQTRVDPLPGSARARPIARLSLSDATERSLGLSAGLRRFEADVERWNLFRSINPERTSPGCTAEVAIELAVSVDEDRRFVTNFAKVLPSFLVGAHVIGAGPRIGYRYSVFVSARLVRWDGERREYRSGGRSDGASALNVEGSAETVRRAVRADAHERAFSDLAVMLVRDGETWTPAPGACRAED